MKPTNLTTESNSSFNMKKFYFVAALTALMTLLAPCAWGETVTIAVASDTWTSTGTSSTGSTTSITKDGITVSSNKGYYTSEHVREYSGSIITISTDGNKYITKVAFTSTTSGTSNNGPSKLSANKNCSYSYNGSVGTATASSESTISLSLKCTAQFRWKSVTITYESACTKHNVTISNNNSGTLTAEPTSACEGKEVTLSYTENDGYYFDSWTVYNTDDLTEYTVTDNKFTMPDADVTVEGSFNTCTKLSAPTNVKTSSVTTTSATITWDAVDNATGGYKVYVTDYYNFKKTETVTTTTYSLSGLTANTQYTASVTAIGDGHRYCESAEAEVDFTTVALAQYTITWSTPDGSSTTTVTEGNTLELPTTPAAPGGCPDKVFVGWSADNIGSTGTDTPPTFISASTIPTGNTTYYAVFATKDNDATSHSWTSYSDWGVSSKVSWLRNSNATLPTFTYTPTYKVEKIVLNVSQSNTTGSQTIEATIGGVSFGEKITSISSTAADKPCDITFQGTTALSGEIKIICTNKSANGTRQGTLFVKSITLYESAYTDYVTQCADCTTPQSPLSFIVNATTANLGEDGTVAIGFSCAEGNGSEPTYTITPTTGCTINGKQLVFSAAGTYTIIARQDLATVGGVTYCGDKASQTITITKDPFFGTATIDKNTFNVACGDTTSMNSAATITLGTNYNLTKDITVAAPEGFLVSINKTDNSKYASSVTLTPTASGENAGKITGKVYVRAYSAIARSNGYSGDITISGSEITTPQKITVSSTVTCQEYELKTNDRGTVTTVGNYYTGATVTAPADPTGVCTDPINYVFDGWSAAEVTDGATSYTKVDFSKYTMPKGGATLYAVYKYAADGSSSPQKVSAENIVDGGKYYITASYNGTEYMLKAGYFGSSNSETMKAEFDATIVTESMAWTFVKSGDNWSIKSGDYYLGTEDDNNKLYSKSSDKQTWTCKTTTTTHVNIINTTYTKRQLALYKSSNWRTYTNSTSTDQTQSIQLYSATAYSFTSTPACGPNITGTKGIQVTSAKGIWVEAADTMEVSATSLDKNEDGAAVSISAEVTSGNFTIKTVGTQGEGSKSLTLTTNCSDATFSQKLIVVYKPTADNTTETGQILLKVYKYKGSTEYATATIDVQGRSLPEQFVIAAKTTDGWVALPSDLGPGSSSSVKAPYTITMDNESNPTKATQAPTTALYKGAERNAANTCANAIRFMSVSNNAYLQASTAASNTGIWLSTGNSNEAQPWKLTSSNFADYNVRVEKSEAGRYLGYDATQGKIANYKQTATLRFLPVENTCTRYDAPSIKSTTATSNKVTLTWTEISGATAYEYSTDQTNWSSDNLSVSTTGGITTAVISGLTATTQYTLSIRVKVTGDNCSDVTSTTFTTSDCDDVPSNLSAYASSNSVTISWTANAATSTVKIYSDAAGKTEVVSQTGAQSPCTLIGLKEKTTYYYRVFAGGSCGSAIESFTTENTDISVVEWFNDSLTVNVNTDGDVSVLIEGKKAHGDASSKNIAEDIFFSKYFEATGQLKLIGLYNGTNHDIDVSNMKIKIGAAGTKGMSDTCYGSGNESTPNTKDDNELINNIIDLSTLKIPDNKISIGTEIIIYHKETSSTIKVDESTQISTCVENTLNTYYNDEKGMKRDNWYEPTNSATVSWSGRQTIALYNGDNMIDIIGAYWKDNGKIKADGTHIRCYNEVDTYFNDDAITYAGDDPGWFAKGHNYKTNEEIILSTNRCLLIRSNSVVSGKNAVDNNRTSDYSQGANFTTLGTEWMGLPVGGAQSSEYASNILVCEDFSEVAHFDYTGYYTAYDSIGGVNQTEIQGHKNSDGTYTIPVSRVDTFACQNIRLQVKNNGTTVTSKDQKVPIIVTKSTNTTNDTLFIKKHTEAECKTCDVVVRDNATLTHVDGGRKEFKDMYIYAGSHLELPDGKEFTLTTLHMHALNDNVSYAKINNDNSSTSSASITVNKLVHVKRIDGHYWYPFSLPYECKIADIKELFGISLGTYGTDWGIKYYDGQERQQQGTASAAGQDGKHWKMMPSDGTLKAYTGYIIGLFYQNENLMRSIYFTPAGTSNYLEDGTDKTTEVTNWKDNLNADKRHHGWNFVGSPYISLFGEGTSGQGLNNTNVKMGYTNTETGEQVDADHVYVTIPNGKDSKTYTQKLAADETIYPFTAYFVQAIDPTDEQSHQLELTYSKGNRSLNAAPRRIASATTDKTIFVELNIDNGDLHDNAGVLVSDQYTTDYEIGSDLIKMYAADAKPQLYTTDIEQSKMAYQSMPDSRAQNIPLGIYVPAAGTYTLSINSNISELDAAQAVYLLHDNDIVANLLFTDYDITAAAAGTISGYALDIRRAQGVATEVSTVNGTQMSIYDGILTISNLPANATVQVYDMLGRVLTNTTANAEVLTVPVHTTGVYTICITSGEQQIVTKTIIR